MRAIVSHHHGLVADGLRLGNRIGMWWNVRQTLRGPDDCASAMTTIEALAMKCLGSAKRSLVHCSTIIRAGGAKGGKDMGGR